MKEMVDRPLQLFVNAITVNSRAEIDLYYDGVIILTREQLNMMTKDEFESGFSYGFCVRVIDKKHICRDYDTYHFTYIRFYSMFEFIENYFLVEYSCSNVEKNKYKDDRIY